MRVALAAALFGCPRPPPAPPPPVPSGPTPDRPVGTQAGPFYWSEPGGLCLEVPAGYSGQGVDPPTLLSLVRDDTGFALELRAWPAAEATPARPGFSLLFEDPDGYRAVPILGHDAGSRTWLSDDTDGSTITSWFAPLGERVVEVSVVAPAGRATEARDQLDPLIHALCTTWLP